MGSEMCIRDRMRHRRLGETAGHGHFNLHLEPTLASWHPRMARPRALAQACASVERPRGLATKLRRTPHEGLLERRSYRPRPRCCTQWASYDRHEKLQRARCPRAHARGARPRGIAPRPSSASRAGRRRGLRQNQPKNAPFRPSDYSIQHSGATGTISSVVYPGPCAGSQAQAAAKWRCYGGCVPACM